MKYIFYIIMILSVGLFLNSCEGDENGKMPDDIKDANAGVLIINAAETDPFINLSDPAAYQVKASVDLLFEGTFNKIDVVVVYNGEYTKQYVLTSVTSVPSDITITSQQFVDVVTELASIADIEEGDVFNLFTSIELSDGTYLPGYTITGDNAITPSVRSQMDILYGGVANLVVNVPCEFIPTDFEGTMEIIEQWNDGSGDVEYTVEVAINAEFTNATRVVYDIHDIFESPTLYQVYVDRATYKLYHFNNPNTPVADQEIIYTGNYYGYGRIAFEDFGDSNLETCDLVMKFTVTPTLPDPGYWWGTTVTYYIGPTVVTGGGTKKSSITSSDIPLMLRPVVPH